MICILFSVFVGSEMVVFVVRFCNVFRFSMWCVSMLISGIGVCCIVVVSDSDVVLVVVGIGVGVVLGLVSNVVFDFCVDDVCGVFVGIGRVMVMVLLC